MFDLVPIQGDYRHELPKTDPGYYFRPHKTMLVRTVAEGGESFYFCGLASGHVSCASASHSE